MTTTHTPARTVYAQRAFDFTDYLREHFRKTVIGGSVPRMVHILAPEVETTGGGRQARQSVHLVARDGSEAPLVCGFIDLGLGSAQLRSLPSLQRLHEARTGAPLEVDQEDFEDFIEELSSKLSDERITVRIVNDVAPRKVEAPVVTPSPVPRRDLGAVMLFGAGVAVGLLLGAVLWSPASPFSEERRSMMNAAASATPAETPAP